jgi:transcriptional regulator with XRE-family HTH domain
MRLIATGSQLRAARNAIDWSLEELAQRSDVSLRTLIRYERNDTVPSSRGGNLEKVIATLEAAGIEFIGTPDDAPGIRIHRVQDRANQ